MYISNRIVAISVIFFCLRVLPTASAATAPYSGTPQKLPGIIKSVNFDLGGEGVAHHDSDSANYGNFRKSTSVDAYSDPARSHLGYNRAGEWLKYTVNVAASGTYLLSVSVASVVAGGSFHLEFDGVKKTPTIFFPKTGGWSDFLTLKIPSLKLTAGTRVMKLVFETNSSSGTVGDVADMSFVLTALATPPNPPVVPPVVIDRVAYLNRANSLSRPEGLRYRYGDPSTIATTGFPTYYKPSDKLLVNDPGQPGYLFQLGTQNNALDNYSSNMGQILYSPDNSSNAGIDAITSLIMGKGTFCEMPQLPWVYYGAGVPDPDALRATYISMNGSALKAPIAMGRAYGFTNWGTNSLVAFQSGLLAAFGTNTSRGKVAYKFPPNKVPTAVALTSNNEFALVTIWDTNLVKGQVAVLALGTGKAYWGDWAELYPGLRNQGSWEFMKLLGYVDLPGMAQPTEISASADLAVSLGEHSDQGWMSSPDGRNARYQLRQLSLSNETNRQSFITGPNRERYARAGFATVISRAEKKAIFLNLRPLFAKVNAMYFGSYSTFLKTRDLGQAPTQWPYAFSAAPDFAPTVVKTVYFSSPPSAVRTSIAPGVNQSYVATADGLLHTFYVGGYGSASGGAPIDIQELVPVKLGLNPTSIAFNKHNPAQELIVAARGARAIQWVQHYGGVARLIKELKDKRMIDPISVEDNDNQGTTSYLVTVADYTGKQVMNFRYGPVIFATNGGARFGMGPDSNALFEYGGRYPVAGKPFGVSTSNVP